MRRRPALTPAHRRHLWLQQGVFAVVLNFVINYGLAWALFRDHPLVALRGDPSMTTDTVITAVLLPIILALVITSGIRRDVARGKLAPPSWRRPAHPAVAWLPDKTWRRGGRLGLMALVVTGVPLIGALHLWAPEGLALSTWLWVKAGYAGVLAGLLAPVLALAALGDQGTPAGAEVGPPPA